MVDTLSDALINMQNCESVGKKECELKPASKTLGSVLRIMQREGLIGNFEFIDDGKAGVYKVQLTGAINKCHSIRPRHAIGANEMVKFEKRYLPAKGIGMIIISTSKGIITHKEAKEMKIGGRLLAYAY